MVSRSFYVNVWFSFNPRNHFKYEPLIVKKTDHNHDYTIWKLIIKKGVRFHNGSLLTAKDIKYSIDQGNQESNPRIDFLGIIKKVEVINKQTLKITLKKPTPRFLETSLYNVPIVPKNYITKIGLAKFKKKPIGSGPYKFVHWEKGNFLLLERNDKYWGGKPAIKFILFKMNLTNEVLNIEIEAGNIDIVPDTEPTGINLGLLRKKVNVHTPESLDYYYINFNINKKPTSDVRFRKAILSAFNFDNFITDLFSLNKGGIRAYSPLPPIMWPQDIEYQKSHTPKYSVKEAEKVFQQLEKEGVLDRSKPLILITRGKRYRMVIMQALANTLAYTFNFTNVRFRVVPEWEKFTVELKDSHMHSFGMGHDSHDPNVDIFGVSPYNYFNYNDEEVINWLTAQHKETDRNIRAKYLINILRKALYKDFIWGMLFHKKSFFLTTKRIQNLYVSGVGYFYLFHPFKSKPISAYLE